MRNKDLIYSVAQTIVNKHYDFEDDCDEDEDDESESFFSMFEVEQNNFWDSEEHPPKTIMRNIAICVAVAILAVVALVVVQTQALGIGFAVFLMTTAATIGIYANRIKQFGRNIPMVIPIGISIFTTTIALVSSALLLIIKIFQG